jgi:glycosyltransferase involved in cell wall biosynthesis
MKVLAISTLYPNRSQPVHALFVEQRILAMAKRFPVTVLCPVPWFPGERCVPRYRGRRLVPRRETRGGVDVRYPRFLSFPLVLKPLDGFFLFLAVLRAAAGLRRSFPFDRIDAHLAYPDGWSAILLGLLFRTPVSVTLRGHDVNDLPRYPVRRRQVAWTLRHASAVFAVADALRERAIELGADPARTFTVANGVDTARFVPLDRLEARRRLGLPLEGPILLSVGHLVARKGFHHLVRALPEILRTHAGARLVIVGAAGEEGDFSEGIRRAVRETGTEDRVTLAGAVTHDELGTWYSAADLFCLASEKEGRPNVVLEALACGTPVVATGVWGTPEIVSRDEVGLLADSVLPAALGARINEALARRWDRAAIVAHSRSFSWDRAAEEVERTLARAGDGG